MALSIKEKMDLGIWVKPSRSQLRRKPDSKSIRPVKESLRLFKKYFNRNESKYLVSNKFIAFYPWNGDNKWYFVTESLPALYSKEAKLIEKIIRIKFPEFDFEIISRYGKQSNNIREELGTILRND